MLPAEIQRRPKMGFGVPLDPWLRGELRDFARHVLLDRRGDRAADISVPEAIERLLDEHQSGRVSHGHRIWALLVLELWHRQWVDGDGARQLTWCPASFAQPSSGNSLRFRDLAADRCISLLFPLAAVGR